MVDSRTAHLTHLERLGKLPFGVIAGAKHRLAGQEDVGSASAVCVSASRARRRRKQGWREGREREGGGESEEGSSKKRGELLLLDERWASSGWCARL